MVCGHMLSYVPVVCSSVTIEIAVVAMQTLMCFGMTDMACCGHKPLHLDSAGLLAKLIFSWHALHVMIIGVVVVLKWRVVHLSAGLSHMRWGE